MTQTDYAEAIARIVPELIYAAQFVPFSQSRNAAEKQPSLNWKITLATSRGALTTDYMQGIGHLPEYRQTFGRKTVAEDEAERNAAESGRWGRGKIPAPPLAEALHSLLSDAEALDFGTFEEWARELGFDADSRAAETTYKACLSIGLQFRAMIGGAAIRALREALADM